MGDPVKVGCRSQVKSEGSNGEPLTAHDVKVWIETVPDGATISPIVVDVGSQRDPWRVLVGLYAEWSESR